MAASGKTPIQLYRSSTPSAAPVAANLADGELAINTADGKLYYKNSSGVVQSISSGAGGTVTSVDVSGGTTGLTTSGGPVTSSGTITLSGTLAVLAGGTGQTSYTNGQLLIGNSATGGLSKATLTAGTNVSITNGNGTITINASAGGGGNVTGPVSSTDNAIALFDGTSGGFIKNSTVTVSSTGVITAPKDAIINGVSVGKGTGSGTNNTCVGNTAGDSMTSGDYNTCIGATAGTAVTTAQRFTGVGYGAFDSASTGTSNTGVGFWAGIGTSTGAYNTAVGSLALGLGSGNVSNSSGLGYAADVTGDNQVQLGNSSTTTYAYGSVQNRSDARDKTQIQDTNLGLNFVMALRPRMFKWDMREDYRPPMPDPATATKEQMAAWQEACKFSNLQHDGTHIRTRYHQGLIAQEVKATMDAMGVDFGGYQDHAVNGGQDVKSIGYNELIAPLIKAIQELKNEFDEYKRTHP